MRHSTYWNCNRYNSVRWALGAIALMAGLSAGLLGIAPPANAQGTQIVPVKEPVAAFYFDANDALLAVEWLATTRTIAPSAKSGIKLWMNAQDLPDPDPQSATVQMGNGVSATAVYVQYARPTPTALLQCESILAVEDMSGVTDRSFEPAFPFDPDDPGVCRCSLIKCPAGWCCPKSCS